VNDRCLQPVRMRSIGRIKLRKVEGRMRSTRSEWQVFRNVRGV
jgi:hypothetical protein